MKSLGKTEERGLGCSPSRKPGRVRGWLRRRRGWLEVGGRNLQGIPGLAGQEGHRLTHQRFSLPRALPW